MALDYRKCAEEIAALIGGGENVVSAAHCATRLRLVIADNDKVQTEKLEEVEGVQGLFESNGQLQLIIGTGTVNKVYDEFLAVTGASAATKEDVKAAAASKMPIWKKMLKSLGDVFVPILPAIVASGLMMGLVEFLGKAVPAFNDSAWFQFLDTVSNTAFTFLPALVAISAARVFGGNLFLGAVIMGCAILSGELLLFVLAGFMFVIEMLSSLLQRLYFKLTHGKRIFKMAPLHHHFEKCGWSEVKIVTVFTVMSAIFCILAFLGGV